jgi:hypothetical protein
MPDAETITKWVAGIVGGIVLALQGINLKEVIQVTAEQTEEITLIQRVHEELEIAIAKQAEMIEILKKQK